MLFSKKCQYALRSLAVLANNGAYPQEGRAMLVADLARESGVPGPFLGKIISELSLAGIVQTRKGRGGGVLLSKKPKELMLGECIEAVDRIQGRRACVLQEKPCEDKSPCPLHELSQRIRREILEKATLATVLGDGRWLEMQ